MKTHFAYAALTVLLSAGSASAELLAGFHNFNVDSDGFLLPENADKVATRGIAEVPQVLAQVYKNTPSVDFGGSKDFTYGTGSGTSNIVSPPLPDQTADNDGYLRSTNGLGPSFTIQNLSNTKMTITSLLFDAASQNGGGTVSVFLGISNIPFYTTPASPPGLSVAGAAGTMANYGDYIVGLNTVLLSGQQAQFNFLASPNGRIDNIAFLGEFSPVPETGTTLALMGLLGSGAAFRSRRSKVA